RAAQVLSAHEEYEAAMKEILTAEADCDRSLAELARLKTELQRVSVEEHALQAEIGGFQSGQHLEGAYALEQAHREAAEKRRDAERGAAELADASRALKDCTEENIRCRTALEQRGFQLEAATDAAADAAVSAGLQNTHREVLAALDLKTADEA